MVKRKYDESDPFRLCRAMGIKLIFQPMGKAPDAVKGFFLESKRIRTITINSDLPEIIQRIIVAHEICHAIQWLLKCDKQEIRKPDRFYPEREFLEYHNDIVFIP